MENIENERSLLDYRNEQALRTILLLEEEKQQKAINDSLSFWSEHYRALEAA